MHLLLYVEHVSDETRVELEHGFRHGTASWWHHLDNIWLLCLGNVVPRAYDEWYNWISAVIQRGNGNRIHPGTNTGRFLLVQLKEGNRFNGLLPEAAWKWIQEHLTPRNS